MTGGLQAGRSLMKGNMPTPTPLAVPKRRARALNEEAAGAIAEEPAAGAN